MSEPSGVVVVNKPSGPTSFDVVRRLKGLFKVKRCGHTGTLDPTATGVLPICVGEATKVAGFIADGEKEYEATVRFGQVTDTQDSAGKVLETRPVEGLREDRAREVLGEFVGLVLQTPPMYSARKVDGRRLYELARAGEEVEREARPVHIEEARLTSFDPPDARVFVRCSIGPFGIEEAVGLDTLMSAAKTSREELHKYLLPVARALEGLAELRLDPQLSRRVAHGHAPGPADLSRLRAPPYARGRRVRLVDPEGKVLAVAESDGVGTLKLLRVLVAGAGETVSERRYDD
ncbi:MAG: tRNA pseudouridine(55) synthase TruB [Deltaproteobacteria bacterium]|nr:MAG: tRNA pseudouridine(55) synthase TruB [Deltaproteobacteria bacterium]